MTIGRKHRLERQTFIHFFFFAAHLPVKQDIYKDEIPIFIIFDMHVRNKKS